ncbi:MAG TPA: hypothetical protein VLS93_06335 [Anaeromyxobacteraceae bacterium]|nr:hypothetical protein [Anaeromyxobacteraceae bacterium]
MSAKTVHLDLDPKDVRILVQSLQNCLETCEVKAKSPAAPCEDCDAARALQRRLEKHLKS